MLLFSNFICSITCLVLSVDPSLTIRSSTCFASPMSFIIKSIEIRKYSEKMCWLDDTEICYEIVGNIYENKKLLEENE